VGQAGELGFAGGVSRLGAAGAFIILSTVYKLRQDGQRDTSLGLFIVMGALWGFTFPCNCEWNVYLVLMPTTGHSYHITEAYGGSSVLTGAFIGPWIRDHSRTAAGRYVEVIENGKGVLYCVQARTSTGALGDRVGPHF